MTLVIIGVRQSFGSKLRWFPN